MPKPATSPIPPGFHSLTIHLMVKGAAGYINFLKKAFGAIEIRRSPAPNGKLMHAEVQIGDSRLMFSDDFCEEMHQQPFATGHLPFVVNLYVPDADATWKQALEAGCEVEFPIADQFWGDRYGQVKDPYGITWAISTHIADPTPEEMAAAMKAMGGGQ
ncbi:MAG TPA: VOC family protein [Bryobacteraceae bacterium]|nr:VOC family protein [Bryobacteraceae bacterium]